MPRIKKTSSQPKRKLKKPVKIVKPVYPEYLQNFINRIETETIYTVKVDQYTETNSYHIGVNKKIGNVHRCIWAANFVDTIEQLENFWISEAFKAEKKL